MKRFHALSVALKIKFLLGGPELATYRFFEQLSKAAAIFGGLVLIGITILTCASIAGRAMIGLGLGPIKGDFELVEAGVAIAVCAFLPWCQMQRGHATVDLFTNMLPIDVNRWINLISEALMAMALAVMTWKLWDGMANKFEYGDTTFILEMPVWWPYLACFIVLVLACVVAAYLVFARAVEASTKTNIISGSGAVH
ncbi:TRAP transporter small permease [Pseudophaeobacter sp. 1A09344]|uniref:TRAP transporter small permease n=1 Tax=Pseudophaeobacter sp. 1A09344 TaxID=3098144 RepID=UPI0034D447F6|nr:TRAP transporter small permease [Thioclava sp. BHET1]